MADADTLATIKTQTLALIEEITANPKPNYNIDGQSVSWGTYLQQLWATVKMCDEQLAGETPIEVHTQGYT